MTAERKKQCIFKREEQVDALLDHIRSIRPEMPVHSVQAEKLLEKQRILEQKKQGLLFRMRGKKSNG